MNEYPTVTAISFTGHGYGAYTGRLEFEYAARLLAFTKNTRLQMSPDGFEEFLSKPWGEIQKELDYMVTTIPSSWEFVDITFTIRNVSRACAQQITRTRFTPIDGDIFGAYAMQSQRVTDMSEIGFHVPASVKNPEEYRDCFDDAIENYGEALINGESLEDARGLLPMNSQCNLVAKYNLRMLVELLRGRDSLRVQDEYQSVALQMKNETIRVWPWSAPFFVPKNQQAIAMIEGVAAELKSRPNDRDSKDLFPRLAKAADLLKK